MMNVKNMEVGLSPPYGDGIETVDTWQPDNMFSPPYGDSIFDEPDVAFYPEFSPPYGDGMKNVKTTELATLFSPPCGDCTLNISQNTAKLKSQRLENVHFIAMMCFCVEKTAINSFSLPCAQGGFMV